MVIFAKKIYFSSTIKIKFLFLKDRIIKINLNRNYHDDNKAINGRNILRLYQIVEFSFILKIQYIKPKFFS